MLLMAQTTTTDTEKPKLTMKDIEALREYLAKLEELEKKKPEGLLTPEEWNEALSALQRTGKIPEKFQGRIGENEVEGREGVELVFDDEGKLVLDSNGEPCYRHVFYAEPKRRKAYYDIAAEKRQEELRRLKQLYKKPIEKVLKTRSLDDDRKSLREMIEAAVSAVPEVLDVTGLPNVVLTSEPFQYALTTYKNENAYIMPFNFKDLHLEYDEDGVIRIVNKAQYDAFESAKEGKIKAAGLDHPLLRQLFAATMKAFLCNYGNSITVYFPSFAQEMGIDAYSLNKKYEAQKDGRPEDAPNHNANDLFKKLGAFEGFGGVWQGGTFYRVFLFEGYDSKLNVLTFSSPYFYKIITEALQNPIRKTRKDGSVMWEVPGVSSLMKPSIVSARSKPTTEIIATLLRGLKQRGNTPNAKLYPHKTFKDEDLIEYKISFKTLIQRIPLIMELLEYTKPSNKTVLLQRYFCGSNYKTRMKNGKGYILEEYIEKYTFIKEYYKDFKITFKPPTAATLSEEIIIHHHGINGDFKKNISASQYLFGEVLDGEV